MDAIEFARSLRRTATPAEKKVWRWLRHRSLRHLKFRRQHPVGPYVLDFYCADLRLCIELDGAVHQYRYRKDVARTSSVSAAFRARRPSSTRTATACVRSS